MPTYVDLLKLFEQSTQQATREQKRIVLELPRPLEEIFPEVVEQQGQPTTTPLEEMLKKEYEHLVMTAFASR